MFITLFLGCNPYLVESELGWIELDPSRLHQGRDQPHLTGDWTLRGTQVCADAWESDCWAQTSAGLLWDGDCFVVDGDESALFYTVLETCTVQGAEDDQITFVAADAADVTAQIHDYWAEFADAVNQGDAGSAIVSADGTTLPVALLEQPDPIRVIQDGTAFAYVQLVHSDGSPVSWSSTTDPISVTGTDTVWDGGPAGVVWRALDDGGHLQVLEQDVREWVAVPASDAASLTIGGVSLQSVDEDGQVVGAEPWLFRAAVLDDQDRPLQGAQVEWSVTGASPVAVAPSTGPEYTDAQGASLQHLECLDPAQGPYTVTLSAAFEGLRDEMEITWTPAQGDEPWSLDPACPEPSVCGCSAVRPGSAALAGVLGLLVLGWRRRSGESA